MNTSILNVDFNKELTLEEVKHFFSYDQRFSVEIFVHPVKPELFKGTIKISMKFPEATESRLVKKPTLSDLLHELYSFGFVIGTFKE